MYCAAGFLVFIDTPSKSFGIACVLLPAETTIVLSRINSSIFVSAEHRGTNNNI